MIAVRHGKVTDPAVRARAEALFARGARLPHVSTIGSPYARRVQPPRRGPAPAVVGSLGHARLAVGDAVAAADLTPIYLRPSEAELKRRGAGLS